MRRCSTSSEFPSDYKASFGPNLSLEEELFAMLDHEIGLEDISAVHQECKNKVSKFVAARVLYRPLRPNEQRPKVVETAKQLVKSLGGILPPKISLLFGYGRSEGSLLIGTFLFVATCSLRFEGRKMCDMNCEGGDESKQNKTKS